MTVLSVALFATGALLCLSSVRARPLLVALTAVLTLTLVAACTDAAMAATPPSNSSGAPDQARIDQLTRQIDRLTRQIGALDAVSAAGDRVRTLLTLRQDLLDQLNDRLTGAGQTTRPTTRRDLIGQAQRLVSDLGNLDQRISGAARKPLKGDWQRAERWLDNGVKGLSKQDVESAREALRLGQEFAGPGTYASSGGQGRADLTALKAQRDALRAPPLRASTGLDKAVTAAENEAISLRQQLATAQHDLAVERNKGKPLSQVDPADVPGAVVEDTQITTTKSGEQTVRGGSGLDSMPSADNVFTRILRDAFGAAGTTTRWTETATTVERVRLPNGALIERTEKVVRRLRQYKVADKFDPEARDLALPEPFQDPSRLIDVKLSQSRSSTMTNDVKADDPDETVTVSAFVLEQPADGTSIAPAEWTLPSTTRPVSASALKPGSTSITDTTTLSASHSQPADVRLLQAIELLAAALGHPLPHGFSDTYKTATLGGLLKVKASASVEASGSRTADADQAVPLGTLPELIRTVAGQTSEKVKVSGSVELSAGGQTLWSRTLWSNEYQPTEVEQVLTTVENWVTRLVRPGAVTQQHQARPAVLPTTPVPQPTKVTPPATQQARMVNVGGLVNPQVINKPDGTKVAPGRYIVYALYRRLPDDSNGQFLKWGIWKLLPEWEDAAKRITRYGSNYRIGSSDAFPFTYYDAQGNKINDPVEKGTLVNMVVVATDLSGDEARGLEKLLRDYRGGPINIEKVPEPPTGTDARDIHDQGMRPLNGWVDDKVADYVAQHGLTGKVDLGLVKQSNARPPGVPGGRPLRALQRDPATGKAWTTTESYFTDAEVQQLTGGTSPGNSPAGPAPSNQLTRGTAAGESSSTLALPAGSRVISSAGQQWTVVSAPAGGVPDEVAIPGSGGGWQTVPAGSEVELQPGTVVRLDTGAMIIITKPTKVRTQTPLVLPARPAPAPTRTGGPTPAAVTLAAGSTVTGPSGQLWKVLTPTVVNPVSPTPPATPATIGADSPITLPIGTKIQAADGVQSTITTPVTVSARTPVTVPARQAPAEQTVASDQPNELTAPKAEVLDRQLTGVNPQEWMKQSVDLTSVMSGTETKVLTGTGAKSTIGTSTVGSGPVTNGGGIDKNGGSYPRTWETAYQEFTLPSNGNAVGDGKVNEPNIPEVPVDGTTIDSATTGNDPLELTENAEGVAALGISAIGNAIVDASIENSDPRQQVLDFVHEYLLMRQWAKTDKYDYRIRDLQSSIEYTIAHGGKNAAEMALMYAQLANDPQAQAIVAQDCGNDAQCRTTQLRNWNTIYEQARAREIARETLTYGSDPLSVAKPITDFNGKVLDVINTRTGAPDPYLKLVYQYRKNQPAGVANQATAQLDQLKQQLNAWGVPADQVDSTNLDNLMQQYQSNVAAYHAYTDIANNALRNATGGGKKIPLDQAAKNLHTAVTQITDKFGYDPSGGNGLYDPTGGNIYLKHASDTVHSTAGYVDAYNSVVHDAITKTKPQQGETQAHYDKRVQAAITDGMANDSGYIDADRKTLQDNSWGTPSHSGNSSELIAMQQQSDWNSGVVALAKTETTKKDKNGKTTQVAPPNHSGTASQLIASDQAWNNDQTAKDRQKNQMEQQDQRNKANNHSGTKQQLDAASQVWADREAQQKKDAAVQQQVKKDQTAGQKAAGDLAAQEQKTNEKTHSNSATNHSGTGTEMTAAWQVLAGQSPQPATSKPATSKPATSATSPAHGPGNIR